MSIVTNVLPGRPVITIIAAAIPFHTVHHSFATPRTPSHPLHVLSLLSSGAYAVLLMVMVVDAVWLKYIRWSDGEQSMQSGNTYGESGLTPFSLVLRARIQWVMTLCQSGIWLSILIISLSTLTGTSPKLTLSTRHHDLLLPILAFAQLSLLTIQTISFHIVILSIRSAPRRGSRSPSGWPGRDVNLWNTDVRELARLREECRRGRAAGGDVSHISPGGKPGQWGALGSPWNPRPDADFPRRLHLPESTIHGRRSTSTSSSSSTPSTSSPSYRPLRHSSYSYPHSHSPRDRTRLAPPLQIRTARLPVRFSFAPDSGSDTGDSAESSPAGSPRTPLQPLMVGNERVPSVVVRPAVERGGREGSESPEVVVSPSQEETGESPVAWARKMAMRGAGERG
ncbi:hypothetical protein IAT38_003340 [Cryptococcus sp. DSM 104549]